MHTVSCESRVSHYPGVVSATGLRFQLCFGEDDCVLPMAVLTTQDFFLSTKLNSHDDFATYVES